jgi:hypothetical protein
MSDIPENVKAICKEIGLSSSEACWELPQRKGTWIMKHKSLEKIAAFKGVKFDLPEYVETSAEKKICILMVQGHLGDKTEWSIGEATAYNNKNSYPFAMAEKRAKDRVILKLVGLHGDVYSEEEADDFKDTQKKTENLVEKDYSVIEGMVRQSSDNPIEEPIPEAVKKYGGKLLSDLKEDELVELQQMVTTKKWAQRIDDALDVFRPAPIDDIAAQGADDPTAPEVVETFKQADTAWLNL